MIAKSWAIKLATEAARTVLSVDQIIVARQAGGPKPPGPNPVSQELCSGSWNLTNCPRTGMKIRCTMIEALTGVQYQCLDEALTSIPYEIQLIIFCLFEFLIASFLISIRSIDPAPSMN
jgi:hypothetical protein